MNFVRRTGLEIPDKLVHIVRVMDEHEGFTYCNHFFKYFPSDKAFCEMVTEEDYKENPCNKCGTAAVY